VKEKMDKKASIIAIVLILIISSALAYGSYTLFLSGSPAPTPSPSTSTTATPQATVTAPSTTTNPTATPTASPTSTPTATVAPTPTPTPSPTSVTVTDGAGNTMTIPLPVERIVSLDGGVTEILCAMGVQNLIVGRTTSCTMPPSVQNVTALGDNDYAPNVEATIELDPDIIFASSMLPYNPTAYEQLKGAGIPVYIVDTTTPEPVNPSEMTKDELYASPTSIDFACGLMQNLTSIVGHQNEVDTYVEWAQGYNKLVKDRIYGLEPEQQVKVCLEGSGYP
jgi:ABC-type Fe3+-hydroxamate transport system substrate-binding protein